MKTLPILSIIEPLEVRLAPSTFFVINTNDTGPGSLRQAIIDANNLAGHDAIGFRLPVGSVIQPETPLPAVTDPLTIHGYLPGPSPQSRVAIDGSLATGVTGTNTGSGLLFDSNSTGSIVNGLAIYGFDRAGIEIVRTTGITVAGCYLGVMANGDSPTERMQAGVMIRAGFHTIGNQTLGGNLIGNNEVGIRISAQARDVTIDNNSIGISSDFKIHPNDIGILVEDSWMTQIGTVKGNLIAANETTGIKVTAGSYLTRIEKNRIGAFDSRGNFLGDQDWGIVIENAILTTIGSAKPVAIGPDVNSFEGNRISGNSEGGIWVNGNFGGVHILHNRIGTENSGESLPGEQELFPIPGNLRFTYGNGGPGILVTGVDETRTTPGYLRVAGNLISGNEGAGIELRGYGQSIEAHIEGNLIGTNSRGQLPLPNQTGILVVGADNVSIENGNVIACNLGDGVLIKDSTGVLVSESKIGLSRTGDEGATNPLANLGYGVVIHGGNENMIIGNFIASEKAGVAVISGEQNLISRNRFSVGSDGLFVDLGGDGVTANDPLDEDTGPNTLLNTPVLFSAVVRGSQTLIRGEYRGAPDSNVRIELYINGEFRTELDVQTNPRGIARLKFDLDEEIAAGSIISASATINLNTSEFSPEITSEPARDVIAKGANSGQKPRVQLRDVETGEVLLDRLAFPKTYRAGVQVTTADIDGDGIGDLIATARAGSPLVKVFSGLDGHEIDRFRVGSGESSNRAIAAGDLDGNGLMEIVVGRIGNAGAMISVHDAASGRIEASSKPFGFNSVEQLSLHLADKDGDDLPEVVSRAELFGEIRKAYWQPFGEQIDQIARLNRA